MAEIEKKTGSTAPEIDTSKPSVNLNFPEKGEIQPEGIDGLSLKDEVTVVIKGTVNSVSAYSGEWGSRSIGVDIKECRIDCGKDKAMGLGDAVEKSRRRV